MMSRPEPDEDGFTLVVRKRRRNNRRNGSKGRRSGARPRPHVGPTDDAATFDLAWKRIAGSMSLALTKSTFFRNLMRSVNEILGDRMLREIVCFGVGEVGDRRNAQFQLACARLLKQRLHPERTAFFEPILSMCGREIVKKAGFSLTSKNEQGKRAARGTTLFFMPHCDLWLYSNVLWANWDAERLSDIVIIGNSFKTYASNTTWSGWLVKPENNCVFRLRPLASEVRIDLDEAGGKRGNGPLGNAFNSTSVICFPSATLSTARARKILQSRPPEFTYPSSQ